MVRAAMAGSLAIPPFLYVFESGYVTSPLALPSPSRARVALGTVLRGDSASSCRV